MYDMESKNLNSFCKNCKFKKVSKILKEKFNRYSQKIFVDDCPTEDKRVVGCTTTFFYEIDWEPFLLFLIEKNFITPEELKEVEGLIPSSNGDSQGIFKTT
jgi:hypothetical protein